MSDYSIEIRELIQQYQDSEVKQPEWKVIYINSEGNITVKTKEAWVQGLEEAKAAQRPVDWEINEILNGGVHGDE